MRQSSLKKEFEKFKETIIDNLYVTFTSIPDGSFSSNQKQSRVSSVEKSNLKENSEILNYLTNLGK